MKTRSKNADEGNITQSKWKLSPTIKPKPNLASKYRMNLKGKHPESKKDEDSGDFDDKIEELEKIVDQLKQFMLMIILKNRCN